MYTMYYCKNSIPCIFIWAFSKIQPQLSSIRIYCFPHFQVRCFFFHFIVLILSVTSARQPLKFCYKYCENLFSGKSDTEEHAFDCLFFSSPGILPPPLFKHHRPFPPPLPTNFPQPRSTVIFNDNPRAVIHQRVSFF